MPIEIRIVRVGTLQAIGILSRTGRSEAYGPALTTSPEGGYPPGLSVLAENEIDFNIVEGIRVSPFRLDRPLDHSPLRGRRYMGTANSRPYQGQSCQENACGCFH